MSQHWSHSSVPTPSGQYVSPFVPSVPHERWDVHWHQDYPQYSPHEVRSGARFRDLPQWAVHSPQFSTEAGTRQPAQAPPPPQRRRWYGDWRDQLHPSIAASMEKGSDESTTRRGAHAHSHSVAGVGGRETRSLFAPSERVLTWRDARDDLPGTIARGSIYDDLAAVKNEARLKSRPIMSERTQAIVTGRWNFDGRKDPAAARRREDPRNWPDWNPYPRRKHPSVGPGAYAAMEPQLIPRGPGETVTNHESTGPYWTVPPGVGAVGPFAGGTRVGGGKVQRSPHSFAASVRPPSFSPFPTVPSVHSSSSSSSSPQTYAHEPKTPQFRRPTLPIL